MLMDLYQMMKQATPEQLADLQDLIMTFFGVGGQSLDVIAKGLMPYDKPITPSALTVPGTPAPYASDGSLPTSLNQELLNQELLLQALLAQPVANDQPILGQPKHDWSHRAIPSTAHKPSTGPASGARGPVVNYAGAAAAPMDAVVQQQVCNEQQPALGQPKYDWSHRAIPVANGSKR
jgi:hypothetical protein